MTDFLDPDAPEPWDIVCEGTIHIDEYVPGTSLSGWWNITLAQEANDCGTANVLSTTGVFSDVPYCPGA